MTRGRDVVGSEERPGRNRGRTLDKGRVDRLMRVGTVGPPVETWDGQGKESSCRDWVRVVTVGSVWGLFPEEIEELVRSSYVLGLNR